MIYKQEIYYDLACCLIFQRKSSMKKLLLSLLITILITGNSGTTPGKKDINFKQLAPGVWGVKITAEKFLSLLEVAGTKPRISALEKLGGSEFPLPKEEITARVVNNQIFLKFPLQLDEQIFGLGLNFKTVFQRGRILRLHVDHYGGRDNGRTHAPVPFYVSSKGYGVLINSSRYIDIYVGTANRKDSPNLPEPRDRTTDPDWSAQPVSDAIEIRITDQNAEILIFAGPELLNAVQRFNLYCGGGCLPPKWGLGFWYRVPTRYQEKYVRKEVDLFRKKNSHWM